MGGACRVLKACQCEWCQSRYDEPKSVDERLEYCLGIGRCGTQASPESEEGPAIVRRRILALETCPARPGKCCCMVATTEDWGLL